MLPASRSGVEFHHPEVVAARVRRIDLNDDFGRPSPSTSPTERFAGVRQAGTVEIRLQRMARDRRQVLPDRSWGINASTFCHVRINDACVLIQENVGTNDRIYEEGEAGSRRGVSCSAYKVAVLVKQIELAVVAIAGACIANLWVAQARHWIHDHLSNLVAEIVGVYLSVGRLLIV